MDPLIHVPRKSEVVDISSGDHTFTLKVTGLWVGGAGTVIAQLEGDNAARNWGSVQGYLLGKFTKVVKTSTTATGILGLSGLQDE